MDDKFFQYAATVALEKSNPTISLNISYIKEKEICPAYISKIK